MADKNQYSEDLNQEEKGEKGGQATDFEDEGRGAQENPEEMGDIE